MNIVASIVAGVAVFLLATRTTTSTLSRVVGDYLVGPPSESDAQRTRYFEDVSFIPWVLGSTVIGLLLAQGDLFLSGAGRSAPALGLLGAAGGWFVWSARRSTRRERRSLRLRHELPVIADAIALHTLAGESVASAIVAVVDETTGVMHDELATIVFAHTQGTGLAEALAEGKRVTAHQDAVRLYEALIHAHGSGGRVASTLGDLAMDLRSGIASDLTSEGGKRAVTSYGPVLALMVPTALLFLLYPTLLGLRALSGAP